MVTEPRDVAAISLPRTMRVKEVAVLCWLVVDDDQAVIEPIRAFVTELAANGTSPTTRRSYCHDLLRWWRFCAAIDVAWDQAGTGDVRDFVRWLQSNPNVTMRRLGAKRAQLASANLPALVDTVSALPAWNVPQVAVSQEI